MANHYETLKVPTNATPKEIKKSFYTLSKANHPDLHPNDPNASQRFVKISEAYATLGSPEKKQRYDRDFLRSSPSGSSAGPGYSGSHSSHMASGPGGRSPSGLSRRRTQFKGPPPSFYRNGGWGDQGAKRQEASEKASHTHEAQGRAASNNNPGGGMGPGGFAQGFADDVPHFDAQGHFKTHEQIQRERMERNRVRARIRRKQGATYEDQGGGSTLFNFFVIGGVLGGIAAITGLFSASGGRPAAVVPVKKRVEVGNA